MTAPVVPVHGLMGRSAVSILASDNTLRISADPSALLTPDGSDCEPRAADDGVGVRRIGRNAELQKRVEDIRTSMVDLNPGFTLQSGRGARLVALCMLDFRQKSAELCTSRDIRADERSRT